MKTLTKRLYCASIFLADRKKSFFMSSEIRRRVGEKIALRLFSISTPKCVFFIFGGFYAVA